MAHNTPQEDLNGYRSVRNINIRMGFDKKYPADHSYICSQIKKLEARMAKVKKLEPSTVLVRA